MISSFPFLPQVVTQWHSQENDTHLHIRAHAGLGSRHSAAEAHMTCSAATGMGLQLLPEGQKHGNEHSCKYICSFVCQSCYRQVNVILFSTTNLESLLRCISIKTKQTKKNPHNLVCSYLKWAWNHRYNPVWCSTTHNDSWMFHFPSEYI